MGADLSLGMLYAGKRARPEVPLLAGDALRLPFADASFDAVTISFALRNVNDTDAALRELARVTRPGGRLVVCEFSTPVNPAFRTVYLSYLMRSLPVVARSGVEQPRGVRLSRRVGPGLAGAVRAGRADRRGRVGTSGVAQPDRWRGGPAPGDPRVVARPTPDRHGHYSGSVNIGL